MKGNDKAGIDRTVPTSHDTEEKRREKSQFTPGDGQEITRTGRETSQRDVQGMPKAVRDDDSVADDAGQNAIGGTPNRSR